MKKLVFIAVIALSIAGCAKPKALQYRSVEHFRVESLSMSESKVSIDVNFYNPNDYALQLKGGNVDVFINDKLLGNSAITEKTSLPAKEVFALPVTINARLKDLLGSALQLLASPEVTLHMKGKVMAGRGGIFIPVPIDFVTKQKIEIR